MPGQKKDVLIVSALYSLIPRSIIRLFLREIPYLDDLIQCILKIQLARLQRSLLPHQREDGWIIVGRSPETEVNEDSSMILRRRHAMGIPIVLLSQLLSSHGNNIHNRNKLCSVAWM